MLIKKVVPPCQTVTVNSIQLRPGMEYFEEVKDIDKTGLDTTPGDSGEKDVD